MNDPAVIPLTNPIAKHWNWQGGHSLRNVGAGCPPETALHWPRHGFTHVDAPCHMIRNGRTLDDCGLHQLCGEAALVDVSDRVPAQAVGSRLLEERGKHVSAGDILILRSDLNRRFPNTTPEYWECSPWLDDSGSHWVVERGCVALVLDFPQDRIARELGERRVENHEFTEHQIVLGAGLMHLEHAIDLHRIPGKRAFLIGLPLRLPGADGGPAGPVALTRWPASNPRIADLTAPLAPGGKVRIWLEKSFEHRDPVQETGVRIDGHVGTHLLTPRYLDAEAEGIDAFLGAPLVGPADLADLSGVETATPISGSRLAESAPPGQPGGRILLIRSRSGADGSISNFRAPLDLDAARWILDRGYRVVGSDFELDAGRMTRGGAPVRGSELESEALLLAHGVGLLRNLRGLGAIGQDRPWVAALPVRLPGAVAAPARVIALEW